MTWKGIKKKETESTRTSHHVSMVSLRSVGLMTYDTVSFSVERENNSGTVTNPQPSSHDRGPTKGGAGSIDMDSMATIPQSQPQPSEAMDTEWGVELSTVSIRLRPPQCQARLYIIGSLLTRSHSRSSVGFFDILSLATTFLVF